MYDVQGFHISFIDLMYALPTLLMCPRRKFSELLFRCISRNESTPRVEKNSVIWSVWQNLKQALSMNSLLTIVNYRGMSWPNGQGIGLAIV
jgi:hypothetical protein